MRSDIRWIGFRQEIPWILILMVVGSASPLPGLMLALTLPVVPVWLFGRHVPKPYVEALHDFTGLTVEASAGRVIVYRWHHTVRPDSYPAFLALADQVYRALTRISMAE